MPSLPQEKTLRIGAVHEFSKAQEANCETEYLKFKSGTPYRPMKAYWLFSSSACFLFSL
jgi:hypothetical protein